MPRRPAKTLLPADLPATHTTERELVLFLGEPGEETVSLDRIP